MYTLQAFNGQGTAAGIQNGVVISPYHAEIKGNTLDLFRILFIFCVCG